MKKALPFLITLLSGAAFFIPHQKSENSCLFYFQNKCYTCDEEDVFFVGLPENCRLCSNKKEKYIESDNKTFWGCLPETFDEENNEITHLPQLDNQSDCPKNYPLKDILGHCYTCQTEQAVQIDGFDYSGCQGKRYLTKFRNSSKSSLNVSSIATG